MPDGNLKLNLAILGLGAVPALRAVRRAIQAVTDAAGEQQRALAAVAQRIEGLGDATELSTPSLARMASELQDITTFGDEAVLEMQAILLTFRELQGLDEAAFRRVTETVLDMAAAMGIDAPSAARQLALAIEDPEAGLRRLRDSGAIFTEQQRETIEGLVETGRRAEALGAILDVLEGQGVDDNTEPYQWRPSNYRAMVTFLGNVSDGDAATVELDDGEVRMAGRLGVAGLGASSLRVIQGVRMAGRLGIAGLGTGRLNVAQPASVRLRGRLGIAGLGSPARSRPARTGCTSSPATRSTPTTDTGRPI